GYFNRHILETAETGTRFFIPECDPHTFALWMASPLAEELLLHPRVTILLCDSPGETARHCREWFLRTGIASPSIRVVVNHSALFPRPTFLRDWFNELTRVFPAMADPLSREIFNTFPKPQNLWENWNPIVSRPGIGLLFGKMRGTPIVVAGAGPSLDLLIPQLRDSRESFLLIACDTSARTLLRHGIYVDIVVAMDSSEKNHDHLRGLSSEDFLPVFYGGAVPSLFQEFRNTSWVTGANPFPTSALIEHQPGPARFLAGKGEVVLNGSVGSSALDLAIRLGGDPIFLAGIDLAYADGKDHVSGTIYDTDPGFQERQPALFQVPDVRGRSVSTCTAFLASLYGMKHQIGLAKSEVHNLSSIGASLPGTPSHDESLYVFKHLPSPTGEVPSEKLRSEASLAERSRRRPLWREEFGAPEMADFFDNRGRWKVYPNAEVRMQVAKINLRVLGEFDDDLASVLARDLSVISGGSLSQRETCQWGKTEEGYPLLTFRDFQGNVIAKYPGAPSPWSEAVEHLPDEPAKDPFIVLYGAGLGSFVRHMCEQLNDKRVYVWEPNLNRIRAALAGANWTTLWSYSNLRWFLGQTPEDFLGGFLEEEGENLQELPVYWRPWIHPGLESWGQKEMAAFHPVWVRFYQGLV
ncbi:MAG: DUF115 domain-containing protein, partial [Candidatus Omnitrophica bacterium]|nr:DUF115 domain-containing protein [Candidatus Omnitrophota bacterium]